MGEIFFILGFVVVIQLLNYYGQKTKRHRAYTNACTRPAVEKTDIVFTGEQSGITEQQVHSILTKRFAYYSWLHKDSQQKFRKRLQSFMHKKTFIIKDHEGFREMPVLVSAAAIQLSFGLKEYRLPFYKYIRIYPEEYFSDHAFLTVLAGNVQQNIISVAWNHILKGYENATDGSNVGLHEMSHALYIQKMVIEENYAESFSYRYNYLASQCKEAFTIEKEGRKNFYSGYADTNLQEFWAESVELFFEKPAAMKEQYPGVFEAMKILLNQDPCNMQCPVLQNHLPLAEKIRRVSKLFYSKTFKKN